MLKTSGQMKTSVIYQTAINSIKDYHGQTTLPFKQFNAKFLSNYEKWLLNKKIGKTERVVGATTVNSYMRTIRAIFNAARVEYNNEDIDDVRIKNYPFRKYKIKEAPLSATKELDAKTIRKIRDSKWKRKLDNQARDMFMISFYLVGINTIDLYNLLKPVNDIITYNRAKTDSRRNDKAEMQIRVEPELKQIIEQYQGLDDKCFNIFQQYSNHEGFTRAFNNGLKRIGKELQLPRKLTTYFVRDSWATIASNDCEVLDDHIEMALNHSIQKKKLTLGYIKKDFSKVWKANRKVIDFLNKKEEEESVPVS